MVALNQIWVVEHSKSQDKFHIETLDVVVKKNAEAYASDTNADRDYVPVAVAESYASAKQMKGEIEKLRNL